jgi:mono/diheme cytochrome c family protein
MKTVRLNVLVMVVSMIVLWSCSRDEPAVTAPDNGTVVTNTTCIGCHSSEQGLKAALGTVQTVSQQEPPVIGAADG